MFVLLFDNGRFCHAIFSQWVLGTRRLGAAAALVISLPNPIKYPHPVRRHLLKFLLILLALLSTSFGLIWLWSWYAFTQWQTYSLATVNGEKSAVSDGLLAGLFIFSTLMLLIITYRTIKNV